MVGRAHAGLHEVNRPEWDGGIHEDFNHALTLVAVIPRAYWTLVHGVHGPFRSTGMGPRSNRPPPSPGLL
jgi:hypothetical protein